LPRPHDDGLQQALLLDRACEARCRLRLETSARLAGIGVDRIDRQLRELRRARLGAADQDFEAAAETGVG
jgi:hypothetical protein